MAAPPASRAAPAAAQPRRRDPPKPSATKRSAPPVDAPSDQTTKKRKLVEPYVRDSQYILRKHKTKQPSLVIHLHPTHFRFDKQDGSFAYDSPMRFFLQHMRHQTVPHEILGEMLANKVQFYDGCLIVEVHNHRGTEGKKQGPRDKSADKDKFSMHGYNQHITPSPYAPFPSKIQAAAEAQIDEKADDPTPENATGKEKQGPRITTVVLHPTEQTRHEELKILANTPMSEFITSKKKAGDSTDLESQDGATASGGSGNRSDKMALDQEALYSIQAEMLVATQPPLYLEPAQDADEAQAIMDLLAHPLHSGKPPSPRERKRTTAEMAADDAQAAEAERRMLIMDERIKPSARTAAGAATSDNQSAAASLGFSRFKTIGMVRENHEKAEREKKEEENRQAAEKRQYEEQAAQQQKLLQAQKQREMMIQQQQLKQRQMAAQQQETLMRQQQMQQQQQANMMQNHGHPGQNNMIQNQQQGNFQNPQVAGVQGSPVPRQQSQTPMMQSSPMVQQGGFPMAQQASNTGAGSPPRPASAQMQHPGVAMARNASQQASGSRNHTPQMANTPSMAQAMPGRQMSQTPRMQPGSPAVSMAQNTPNGLMMQGNGQMNPNLTPEQMAMLQAQRALNSGQGMPQGQGQGQGSNGANLTPQDIQYSQQMSTFHKMRQAINNNYVQAQQMGDHGRAHQEKQRMLLLNTQVKQFQATRQQQMAGNAGSPGVGVQQATPQMGHAHPGQQQQGQQHGNMQDTSNMSVQQQQAMAQQQFAQQQRQAHQQLQAIAQRHGGTIPQQVINDLPPHLRQLLHQQQMKQQQARAQAQARMQQGQQQQQQQGNGNGAGSEQYVQQLHRMQNQLGMQMGQPQQHQGGNMGMPMNMNNMQQFAGQQQQQGQGQGDPLQAQFAAMANALQRGGQGMQ